MRPIILTAAGQSVPIVLSHYLNPFSVGIGITLSGTASYSVEYTYDDIFSSTFNPSTAQWFTMSGIPVGTATSKDGTISSPVMALRLNAASLIGTLTMTVLQAGALGVTGPGKDTVVTPFSPYALFSSGEQGVWYDPSDINLAWRRNLLTRTEDFADAVWIKAGATVEADNIAAPDGSMTADGLTENTATASHSVYRSVGSLTGAYTASCYVKAAGRTWCYMEPLGNTATRTYFNLSGNGSVGTTGAGVTASITAFGNNWYRIVATYTYAAATGIVAVGAANSDAVASYAGNGTVALYLWGAQLETGSTASAYQKITDGVQDYYTYGSSLPILYQDAAGTTPVTAVEQPVGLMLDKSRGLVLGSELVTNGDFASGTTAGFTQTSGNVGGSSVIAGELNVVASAGGSGGFYQDITVVQGATYLLSVKGRRIAGAGSVRFQAYDGAAFTTPIRQFFDITTTGPAATYSAYIRTTSTTTIRVYLYADTSTTGGFDDVSVKLLPGNHASQATATSRPVLSARVNLLTKTEDITVAGTWNYQVSSVAVDYQTVNFTGNGRFGRLDALTTGIQYIYSVEVKAGTKAGSITFLDSNNNSPLPTVTLNSSWQRLSFAFTPTNTPYISIRNSDGNTGTVLVRNWDLRVANDGTGIPAYQRVNTSTDYDTAGFPLYLRADGVDDGMQTGAINFSATDKMTVWAGVRKLSDSAQGIVAELSASVATNAGAFYLAAPNSAAGNYAFASDGTGTATAIAATFAAPVTNVLSAQGAIGTDVASLRVNAGTAVTDTTDQGTGNYGTYPLYIFRRGGVSQPFNGRLYSLIVRGAASTASQIAATETWVNTKTGAY